MYWYTKIIVAAFIVLIAGGLLYSFRAFLPRLSFVSQSNEPSTGGFKELRNRSEAKETEHPKQISRNAKLSQSSRPPPLFLERLTKTKKLLQDGELLNAKKMAENILLDPKIKVYDHHWVQTAEVLSRINTVFLFTDAPCPEKENYTIVAGDSLIKIANRFKTTVSLIQKSNGLDETNPMIYSDQVFRIYQADWNLKVSKSQFTLTLHDGDRLLKYYKIGIGRQDRTPVGTFVINLKDFEPDWWRPGRRVLYGDPENVLGTRWLGFVPTEDTDPTLRGFGIHGTWQPESIGKAASQGCIRMLNEDVNELFDIVPVSTRVVVIE